MNYIDYHVISTAVIGGLSILLFLTVVVGVAVSLIELFNEKDDQ